MSLDIQIQHLPTMFQFIKSETSKQPWLEKCNIHLLINVVVERGLCRLQGDCIPISALPLFEKSNTFESQYNDKVKSNAYDVQS